ncbi:hypothetical protein [Enterobacter bugandensis]
MLHLVVYSAALTFVVAL